MPTQEVYTSEEKAEINGTTVTIQKVSKYEIPWTKDKSQRPQDYFLQMATHMTYEQNGKQIKVTIPPASSEEENRRRQLAVTVDGAPYPFTPESVDILNMDQTFDIPEMERLMALATENKAAGRVCVPFHFMSTVNHQGANLGKTNGLIQKILPPYIQAIKKQKDPRQSRELFFPIVMPGRPHHWVACVLRIDDKNNPKITYLDSTPKALAECSGWFNEHILPGINASLSSCGYPKVEIQDISYNVAKQFSQKGCGIAASATLGKLMVRKTEEDVLLRKNVESFSTNALNMEEDAFLRVSLALKVTHHELLINDLFSKEFDELKRVDAQQPLPKQIKRVSEAPDGFFRTLKADLLRELKTDPRILAIHAEEQFQSGPMDSKGVK